MTATTDVADRTGMRIRIRESDRQAPKRRLRQSLGLSGSARAHDRARREWRLSVLSGAPPGAGGDGEEASTQSAVGRVDDARPPFSEAPAEQPAAVEIDGDAAGAGDDR